MKWHTGALAAAAAGLTVRRVLVLVLAIGLVLGYVGPNLVVLLGAEDAVRLSASYCREFLQRVQPPRPL